MLASSTFHDQSRQGRAHISEVSPQNGREKGGERRRDNMVRGDVACALPTRDPFCWGPASTILTPTRREAKNF